jgi:hypothetical protein
MSFTLEGSHFDHDDANALFQNMVTASNEPMKSAATTGIEDATLVGKGPGEAAGETSDKAPAPAPSGDKFDKVVAFMTQPISPAMAIKAGNLPAPKTNVRFVSKEDDGDDRAAQLHDALDAMIGLSEMYGHRCQGRRSAQDEPIRRRC